MASEIFLGHSLSSFGIESVYDYCVQNFDWLRGEYMKALPALTFLSELPGLKIVNGEARAKIEMLERALAEKELELQVLPQKLAEFEATQRRIEALLTDDVIGLLKKLREKGKL